MRFIFNINYLVDAKRMQTILHAASEWNVSLRLNLFTLRVMRFSLVK